MDRVRLGRALGRGARAAARTAYEAAAAAAAPAPVAQTKQPTASSPRGPAPSVAVGSPTLQPRRTQPASRPTQQPVQRSRPSRARAAFEPVRRASRAVSLQISGSFFALFAVSFLAGAFRFHNGAPAERRVWLCVAIAVMFAYFAASNFLRARRLSRA